MAAPMRQNGRKPQEAHDRPSIGAPTKRLKVSAEASAVRQKHENGGVYLRRGNGHAAGVSRQGSPAQPTSSCTTPKSGAPSPREKENGCRQLLGAEEHAAGRTNQDLQVIIRTRPLVSSELAEQGHARCLRQDSDYVLTWLGHPEAQFVFDYVARDNITQQKFFFVAGLPVVDHCISGYNSSLFTYGQIGSGKTHTMIGNLGDLDSRSSNRGITPRMFDYLFARIRQDEEARRHEHLQYVCKCSYVETIDDEIRDLLQPMSGNVQKEDAEKRVYVENLTQVEVAGVPDVIQLLLQGLQNKKNAGATMDGENSMCHSIFTCLLESKWEYDSMVSTRGVRLNLVELAAPDRQKRSGAEGEYVSKSLATLGLVLPILNGERHATREPQGGQHRHTKLMDFFQDSLGNHSKATLVAHVSPSICSAMKTLSTLTFAQNAKSILHNDATDAACSGNVRLSESDTTEGLATVQSEVIRLKTVLLTAQSSNSQKEMEWDKERGKLNAELHDGQAAKEKLVEAASVMKALLQDNQKWKCDAESWRTESIKLSRDQEEYKAQLCAAEEKVNAAFASVKMSQASSEGELVIGKVEAKASTSSGGPVEYLSQQNDSMLSSEASWINKLEMLLSQSTEAQKRLLLVEPQLEAAVIKLAEFEKSKAIYDEQGPDKGGGAMQTLERLRLELEDTQSLASTKSAEVEKLEARVRKLEHEAESSRKEFEEAQKKIVDAREALAEAETADTQRLQLLQLELEQATSLAKEKASEIERLEQKVNKQEQDAEISHSLLQAAQVMVEDLRKGSESDQSQLSAELQRLKAISTAARDEADLLNEKLLAANKQVEDLNDTLTSVKADMRHKEMESEEERLSLLSQLQQQRASFSEKESRWADERKGLELQLQQAQLDAVGINDKYAALNSELETARTCLVQAESAHKQGLLSMDKEKQGLVSAVNATKEACSALEFEVQRLTAQYTGMQEQYSRTKDDWRKDREQLLAANKALASTKEAASKKSSEVQQLEGKIVQLEHNVRALSQSLKEAREEMNDATEVWESEKSQLCLQLEHFKAATTTTRNEAIALSEKLLAAQGELKDLGDTLETVKAQSTERDREWKDESAALNFQLQQGELKASRIKDEVGALQAEAASLNAELAQAKDLYQQSLASWDKEKQNLTSKGNERCSSLELEVQRLNNVLAGAEKRLSRSEDELMKHREELVAERRALASAAEAVNQKTSEAQELRGKLVQWKHEVTKSSQLLTEARENMENKTRVWKSEKDQLYLELEQFKATVTSLSAELELLRCSSAKAEDAHGQVLVVKEREKQNLLHRLDVAQEVSSGLELELKRVTSLCTETQQRLLEAQVTWMTEKQQLALQLGEANALVSIKVSECNQFKAEVTRYESYMSNLHAMLVAAKKSSRVKDTKWNDERAKLSLQLQQAELDKTRTMDEVTLLLNRVEGLEGELESLKGSIAESEHSPEQCMTEMMEKGLQREKERLRDLAAGIKGKGPEVRIEVEHLHRTRQEIRRIEDRIRKLEWKHNSLSGPSQKATRTSMHLSAAPSTTSSYCPHFCSQENVIVLDSDFHVFDNDRTEKEIIPNQVWAMYEEHDGMPRRYGQILEIQSIPFKVVMRWLVPVLSKQGKAWVAFTGMALSCGDFKLGKQRVVDNVRIFSHLMAVNGGTDVMSILPKKHDVWALYQTSDNKWPDANKEGGKQTWYDIVEVMGDFSEEAGVLVAPLSKVPGFRTLFQQSPSPADTYCTKDLFRFSHKVPAYKMAGDETAGLPKDCLELDPASVPLDMICG